MTPLVLKRLRVRLGILAVIMFAVGLLPHIINNAIAGAWLFGIMCGCLASFLMTFDL